MANREKYAARFMVREAVMRGKRWVNGLLAPRKNGGVILLSPPFCPWCGVHHSAKKIVGHHAHGYEREQWYDVVWMCTACHGRLHSLESAAMMEGHHESEGQRRFMLGVYNDKTPETNEEP